MSLKIIWKGFPHYNIEMIKTLQNRRKGCSTNTPGATLQEINLMYKTLAYNIGN